MTPDTSQLESHMQMGNNSTMNYRGLAKGNSIELTEPHPFPEGQPLRVSVEVWPSRAGNARTLRQAMHTSPHLAQADVDELEAVIHQGKIPVNDGWVFNEGK